MIRPYDFNVWVCASSRLHVTCGKFCCYDVLNVHAVSFITSHTVTANRTSISPLRLLVFHFGCNRCVAAITNCLHSNHFVPFTFVTHLCVVIPWAHFVTANAFVVVFNGLCCREYTKKKISLRENTHSNNKYICSYVGWYIRYN